MPAVLPVTIATEETQARSPSTKKTIYVLTAIYHNRAVVSTGRPLTTTRYHVLYVLHLHASTHTGYRVCFRFYYTGIHMCTNIDDAIPLPGHNYYCSKKKLYDTQCYSDVLTIQPHHSVNSTDTWWTISTTNVHILRFVESTPTIFLSTFLAVLV